MSSSDRAEPLRSAASEHRTIGHAEKTTSLYGLMAEIEAKGIGDPATRDFSSASLRAGSCVRAMRKKAGLSQKGLADVLGVSQARISEIEAGQGRHGPTWDVMERIAEACDHAIDVKPLHDPAEIDLNADFEEIRAIAQVHRSSVVNELNIDLAARTFEIEEVGHSVMVTTSISAASIGSFDAVKVMLEPVAVAGKPAAVDALLAAIDTASHGAS